MSRRASKDTPLFACMKPEPVPEPTEPEWELAPGSRAGETGTEPREPVKCTRCQCVAPWDHFDCMGLDEDELQCPECGFIEHMERFI